MNYGDDWEARGGGGVADRGLAIIGVPAKDIVGEALARYGVHTPGQFQARGGHLEDVRPSSGVEYVRPLQETRERLAVLAVADEAETAGRRNLARNAAHMVAPASKREI